MDLDKYLAKAKLQPRRKEKYFRNEIHAVEYLTKHFKQLIERNTRSSSKQDFNKR